MKRWFLPLVLIVGLFAARPAFAVVATEDDGTYVGDAVTLDFDEVYDVSQRTNSSTHRIRPSSNNAEKSLIWGPDEFVLSDQPVVDKHFVFTPLSTTTTPGLATKVDRKTGFVKWADNEDTPVQKTFRVPTDYRSGGAFRVMLGQTTNGANPPAIDYAVYVNQTATAFDTSATNQTAAQINTVGDGSPEVKALSVTTDFATLAAGDLVTVDFWRDNTNTSTADLELYYAEFYYSTRDST